MARGSGCGAAAFCYGFGSGDFLGGCAQRWQRLVWEAGCGMARRVWWLILLELKMSKMRGAGVLQGLGIVLTSCGVGGAWQAIELLC